MDISADSFIRGESINVTVNQNYENLVTGAGGAGDTKLTYRFHAERGAYQLEIFYAADERRPVIVEINGVLVSDSALSTLTGSWTTVKREIVGRPRFKQGENILVIRRAAVIPHIRKIAFNSV